MAIAVAMGEVSVTRVNVLDVWSVSSVHPISGVKSTYIVQNGEKTRLSFECEHHGSDCICGFDALSDRKEIPVPVGFVQGSEKETT